MPRSRRNSIDLGAFAHRETPATINLQNSLGVMNSHVGVTAEGFSVFYNPHGNCTACAFATAMVLTQDNAPPVIGGAVATLGNYGKPEKLFEDSSNRAQKVWLWLCNQMPPGSVFAAESDDHAWNFVKDTLGRIFLIDSNQQIFKRLTCAADAQRGIYTDDPDDRLPPFNYLDPDGDDDEELTLYYWGLLHPNWRARLEAL